MRKLLGTVKWLMIPRFMISNIQEMTVLGEHSLKLVGSGTDERFSSM